jgi:23S rRNA (adenine2503-C2)-methyltransferase
MGREDLHHIFNLDLDELIEVIQSAGLEKYRAKQIWHAIYTREVDSPDDIHELSRESRVLLGGLFSFSNLHTSASVHSQDDRTEKILFKLPDENTIETVIMNYDDRHTVCISSQVGCGLGCVFCATGQMGLRRNLSKGEVVEQVVQTARMLQRGGNKLSNVVVMGMGEPFQNYEAVMGAVDILNDPHGFNFGARRFTISTVGLVPGIEKFTQERRQVNLAVSLHAATDELRDRLLPINKQYPLEILIPACRRYVHQTGRRITFEWALIEGENDSLNQARILVNLVKGMRCHVNIIPLNVTRGYAGHASARVRVDAFHQVLTEAGINCSIRVRRGIDIHAGCGQLAAKHT